MTTLTPQPSLEKLVADGALSFDALMDYLAEAGAGPGGVPQAPMVASTPPPPITVSDDQRVLLRRLAVQLAELSLPDKARRLSEQERREFISVWADIKSGKEALVSAETALRETFANHLDVEARRGASPESPVVYDRHWHVLAEGEVTAPGAGYKVTRELRGGKAARLTLADLQCLEEDGKIDHKTFLRMTEAVPATRRVDEARIMDLLAKRPELVAVLAEVATATDRTAAYCLRKAK